ADHEELALQPQDEPMQAGLDSIRQGAKAGSRQAQVGDRLIGAAVGVGAEVRLRDPRAAIEEAGGPGVTLAGVDAHRRILPAEPGRPAQNLAGSAAPASASIPGRTTIQGRCQVRTGPFDGRRARHVGRTTIEGRYNPSPMVATPVFLAPGAGWDRARWAARGGLEEAGWRLPTIGEERHLDWRPNDLLGALFDGLDQVARPRAERRGEHHLDLG